MILCYYDVTAGGNAPDFVNLDIFTQFFARKLCTNSCIWLKVVKKATSNILKSLIARTVKVIRAEFLLLQGLKGYWLKSCQAMIRCKNGAF